MRTLRKAMLIALAVLCLDSPAFAQAISLKMSNTTVKEAMDELKKTSGYVFVFSSVDVDTGKRISVNAENADIRDVVSQILQGQDGLTYVIDNKTIVVKQNSVSSTQQERTTVKGKILDSTGTPVIGAAIKEVGTTNGTITDLDGNFTLNVNTSDAMLEISYVGFQTQTLKAQGNKVLAITLQEDTQALDEVVVVGYGTQKKVNLTGAVTSVKSDLLENRTTSSAVNIITGQMPGVTIIQSNGQPGFDTGSLRVRGVGTMGNADAMVVVDGVESSLDVVDPNDIETITVLKDAAASAIYGVRAANGVILVTTKKGQVGKPVITYNAYVGWQSITRHPEYLGSADYAMLLNEAYRNDGLPEPYTEAEIELFRNGTDPDHYPNTDWFNALFNRSGVFHNHHISMSGGTERTKYSVSMGYHNKEGLMANTGFRRFNMRFNIDTEINDRLSFNLNAAVSRDRTLQPTTNVGTLMYWNLRETPVTPIQFKDGRYALFQNEHNSVAFAKNGGQYKSYDSNFLGSASLTYKIMDGLTLKGIASATYDMVEAYDDTKSMDFYSADSTDPIKTTRSYVENIDQKSFEINLQTYLEYAKTFGKHDIKAMVGYSQIQNEYKYLSASRYDLPANNSLNQINAGDITTQETEGYRTDYALRSGFGRVNYAYDGRYLFEANLRYDGTSRFPKNNRFGLFPSFSLGWRISEEAFFNAENIDNLKLRASWGQLGNQEIGDYAFYNTYVFGMDYAFNNQLSPGVSINETMGNSNITWEKTSQLDLGIDIDAWNGKLSATFDYFDKKTNDILLALPTPDILGVSSPMQNAGSVLNRGFEFSITHRNRINDFSYGVNFNFSYVHNEITDLKGADQPGISVGDPVQNVFGYICDGIFRSQEEIDNSPQQIWGAVPGDLKYRDVNGDNVVDDDDRVSIGSDFPSINYGFRLEMGYKNFDFSTLLQGAGDVHALVRDEIAKPFHNGGKVTSKFLDSWTPENPDASCPRLSIQNATKNKYVSTYWVQNASYLKMRNIQLGYTFAPNITKRLGLSRLRMYFSADNVFTITSFEGVDPESTGNNYPLTRSYSFGVNVSF